MPNIFADNFSKLMFGPCVFQMLFQMCLEHATDILSFRDMSSTCLKESVEKSVALFLRILLYHKVKVLNRELTSGNSADKPGKKNRKAMKVMHK